MAIRGHDLRYAKAPMASKFAPGEFVIFSALVAEIAIARSGELLRDLVVFAYGGGQGNRHTTVHRYRAVDCGIGLCC